MKKFVLICLRAGAGNVPVGQERIGFFIIKLFRFFFLEQAIVVQLFEKSGGRFMMHLAGCYLPADIYVRYQRAQKRDIKFIGGSDEHGVPITIRAMKEGVSPQQIVDKYHAQIKESFDQMGISFDIYSRTSAKVHHETSSEYFKTLYDKGIFEEKVTEQYFDP